MRDGHRSSVADTTARIEDRFRTDQILFHNLRENRGTEVVAVNGGGGLAEFCGFADFTHVAERLNSLTRCILHIFRNLFLWARDDLLQADSCNDAVDQMFVLLRAGRSVVASELELDRGLSLERRAEFWRDVLRLGAQQHVVVEQQLVR